MSDIVEYDVNNSMTDIDVCHLSAARERILQALLNPEFIGLSITEKCQRINVSRQAWYVALHDSKFMEFVNKTSLDVLKENIAPVMAALSKSAASPNPRSNPDRRLFFELTGHTYKEGDRIQIINIQQERGD